MNAFLGECNRKKIAKIQSVAKLDTTKYLRISNDADFYGVVESLVARGLKVAVCCNTKDMAKTVHSRLSETFSDKKGFAIYNE